MAGCVGVWVDSAACLDLLLSGRRTDKVGSRSSSLYMRRPRLSVPSLSRSHHGLSAGLGIVGLGLFHHHLIVDRPDVFRSFGVWDLLSPLDYAPILTEISG